MAKGRRFTSTWPSSQAPPRSCYQSCCCACALANCVIFAVLLATPSFWVGFAYYRDWIGHQAGGVDFHLGAASSNGTAWHAGKKVILRHAAVVERLRALPADLEAQAGVRHLPALAENDINPAGYEGLSSWPQIALGAAPAQHTVMREFINARVSAKAPASLWNAEQLRRSAATFLGGLERLDVQSAACAWVDVELWRIVLGVHLPLENATRLCDSYMLNFLLHYAVAPDWTRRLPSDPFGFGGVKAMQMEYIASFRASSAVQAYAHGDAAKAALAAHAAHDAIAVAGGLSVPGLISKTIWLLHNGSGLASKGLASPLVLGVTSHQELRRAGRLRALVLELARLLPEVTHVPVEYHGEPTLLSVEAALVDPAVWGEGAREIRLYRKGVSHDVRTGPYGTAWAHQVIVLGCLFARLFACLFACLLFACLLACFCLPLDCLSAAF